MGLLFSSLEYQLRPSSRGFLSTELGRAQPVWFEVVAFEGSSPAAMTLLGINAPAQQTYSRLPVVRPMLELAGAVACADGRPASRQSTSRPRS